MANRQLFLKAATTAHYVGQVVDRQLAPIGIPAYLLSLLTHVRDHAPVSPSTVASASGVPPTTLRDNIQRLVDRRLVRRVANPKDGRSYLLVLTRRGEAVTQAANPVLLEAYLALEQRLGRPLTEYEQILDELTEALADVLAAPRSEATMVARH